MDKQPPSYSDYNPGYNPAPGYPNQTGYPQGQPYGAPYQGQPVVTVQPTVHVAISPLAQPLPDYLGYSIFTMLCCFLPLGIAALVFSIKTRDANTSGNRPQAERSSRTARILNNTALGIGLGFIIAYIARIVINNISY